jgi:hypothetical protein
MASARYAVGALLLSGLVAVSAHPLGASPAPPTPQALQGAVADLFASGLERRERAEALLFAAPEASAPVLTAGFAILCAWAEGFVAWPATNGIPSGMPLAVLPLGVLLAL